MQAAATTSPVVGQSCCVFNPLFVTKMYKLRHEQDQSEVITSTQRSSLSFGSDNGTSNNNNDLDETMQATQQERQWARAIKQAAEADPDVNDALISDLEYMNHAIVAMGKSRKGLETNPSNAKIQETLRNSIGWIL